MLLKFLFMLAVLILKIKYLNKKDENNEYKPTEVAKRYKQHRKTIYRWIEKYDGTLESLKNKSIRQHHNVEKGLYYYIYAIGDKFNMPNLERMSAFNANLGNKIDGEIDLPETCCIIGNYAFYNAKPTGSSTLNLPKNIN